MTTVGQPFRLSAVRTPETMLIAERSGSALAYGLAAAVYTRVSNL
jgi:hypothetical protein